MTARRPADIARWLRHASDEHLRIDSEELADELDALDARWPTADEIEQMRCVEARLFGYPMLFSDAGLVRSFLDRLEPPAEPQADDDVDGNPGVDYCLVHHGLRNEDEHRCADADDDLRFDLGSDDAGEPRPCVLVPLSYDIAAARAALDARQTGDGAS